MRGSEGTRPGTVRSLPHFRRTAAVGVVATGAVTLAAAALGPGASAQEEGFNRGTGQAIAQSIRVNPVAGGLSFGLSLAEALAGHQNTVATAEARSLNLGVIGTTLAGEGCDGGDPTLPAEDQPQALRVDSSEEGAADGRSGQDPKVPGVDRQVRATTDPFAEAIAAGGSIEVPGVLHVEGARSTSHSGVVDGNRREAVAVAEVGRLALAGVIDLRAMRWEARHLTGAADEQSGTFTIGSLSVGGTPVPVDDPVTALAQANEALRPLGFELRPPRYHLDETSGGTIAIVDPLGIRVIPSPLRDGVVSPVLSELQPVRTDVFNALIEMDCGNATYITVLDILLNAFGPGGYFAIELGGVQATTAELQLFQGLGELGALPALAPTGPASGDLGGGGLGGGSAGIGSPPVLPAESAAPPPAAASAPGGDGTTDLDAVDAASIAGTRGGALAAVGGTGLLALLGTAEADRRKMRAAQRQIPVEA